MPGVVTIRDEAIGLCLALSACARFAAAHWEIAELGYGEFIMAPFRGSRVIFFSEEGSDHGAAAATQLSYHTPATKR